jgi:hypothetical protein
MPAQYQKLIKRKILISAINEKGRKHFHVSVIS